jgi:hypothetical protein
MGFFLLAVFALIVAGAVWFVVRVWRGVSAAEKADTLDEVSAMPKMSKSWTAREFAWSMDLRNLDHTRYRIRGSAYAMTDKQRVYFGGAEYVLVREDDNPHDENAIAIYGKALKVGYVSASKAAGLAPLIDTLAAQSFIVSGAGVTSDSIRLWVDVPSVVALRRYVKAQPER